MGVSRFATETRFRKAVRNDAPRVCSSEDRARVSDTRGQGFKSLQTLLLATALWGCPVGLLHTMNPHRIRMYG